VDIELLRTFLAVSQVRHFGRAADQLFLTPAAVSARIRQLEQTLGVSLFHRTRGNIRLTEEGERLLPHARKLQDAWAEAQRDLSLKPQTLPSIRIGCPPGLWHWLEPLLTRLQKDSGILLTLETCPVRDIHALIVQQRLDLGLLFDAPYHDDVKTRLLTEKALKRYHSNTGSSDHTIFVNIDWGPVVLSDQRLREPIPSQHTVHTNDPSIALHYLQQHNASCWLPDELAETADIALTGDDKGDPVQLPVYLACRVSSSYNPILSELIESL